jgi:hypothetical protein
MTSRDNNVLSKGRFLLYLCRKNEENAKNLSKNLQNPQKCGHICRKIQFFLKKITFEGTQKSLCTYLCTRFQFFIV